MNVFFVPQLGSMIYTMNGMVTRLKLRADKDGNYQGLSAHFTGDGFPDMMFDVHVISQLAFPDWVANTARSDQVLNDDSYKKLAQQTIERRTSRPIGSMIPLCSRPSRPSRFRRGRDRRSRPRPAQSPIRRTAMFGKLSWSAIPFDQPIPLVAAARRAGRDPGGAGLGRGEGPSALSLARMDHQRRPQADRRDVHRCSRW